VLSILDDHDPLQLTRDQIVKAVGDSAPETRAALDELIDQRLVFAETAPWPEGEASRMVARLRHRKATGDESKHSLRDLRGAR